MCVDLQVRDVADEKGSIMEAVDKCGVKPSNGVSTSYLIPQSAKLLLSPLSPREIPRINARIFRRK